MTRKIFLDQLNNYATTFQEEQKFVPLFVDILDYPNAYERNLLDRHLTASAWVLHPKRNQVLLLHHAKLDRWLQPGGHADGDQNLLQVAQKEVEEETGLSNLELIGESFFDLDIHTIPERKEVPTHDHYDVRYAFIAHDFDKIQKNHESNDLQWVSIEQVGELTFQEQSMVRMIEKTSTF
ncbi:NUDIX hydrolase [Reichenbachiella versicolor]|uniref:NUDIX hydrolase n=1 Tax=Reichenbachiella versicolor TaxID=1821036 RepID=UPI000D6DFA9D|nr:NUDIX hydrolase [Reichenbachiella versicolor]